MPCRPTPFRPVPIRPTPLRRRLPRAGVDPIRTPAAALAVASLAVSCPGQHETVAFLLDDAYRGTGLMLDVTGTDDHDSVVRVAELVAEAASSEQSDRPVASHLVVLSIRPGSRPQPDDAERWQRASDVADALGVTLLEWFVLDNSGVWTPRDLTGEPDRWPR